MRCLPVLIKLNKAKYLVYYYSLGGSYGRRNFGGTGCAAGARYVEVVVELFCIFGTCTFH